MIRATTLLLGTGAAFVFGVLAKDAGLFLVSSVLFLVSITLGIGTFIQIVRRRF